MEHKHRNRNGTQAQELEWNTSTGMRMEHKHKNGNGTQAQERNMSTCLNSSRKSFALYMVMTEVVAAGTIMMGVLERWSVHTTFITTH